MNEVDSNSRDFSIHVASTHLVLYDRRPNQRRVTCVPPDILHKKGEVKMSNKFKAGDLVFELNLMSGIKLTELTTCNNPTYSIRGRSGTYTASGLRIDDDTHVPGLLHATPEMREKLVAIWGEDAVPELPLRGSELTRKLLEKQKYVMCWVCNHSDEQAREWPHSTCIATAVEDDGFTLADGGFACYAVPIDVDGNEITEVQ